MGTRNDIQAKANPDRRKKRLPRKLGRLQGGVSLRLHTIQAVRVFCGRRRTDTAAAIPGLHAFAKALDSVAKRPDPKGIVSRISAALREADLAIGAAETESAKLIQSMRGLTLDLAQSSHPQVFDLRLRSPHAFHAARLIGRFDHLVATLMTLNHVGALDRRGVMKRVDIPMRRLRHPFNVACDRGERGVAFIERRPGDGVSHPIARADHVKRIANV